MENPASAKFGGAASSTIRAISVIELPSVTGGTLMSAMSARCMTW